ncbi:ATP-binding protein [Eubacterium sp.]|uniref:ATP-binding protein n=1 Tax=Eubacterium sp. TaxID=142586 RepID=UPI002FC99E98
MEECENVLLQLLENSQSQDRLILTGYKGLDAVLSSKIQIAKDKGVVVESTIALLGKESLFVDEIDISFICANLLDNAIEAAEACLIDHPKIVFTVKYDTDLCCLRIYCENPTIHTALKKTTKKDVSNHGFGLSTVQEIAEQYNGLANYNILDGCFTIIVTLENIPSRKEQKNAEYHNLR